MAAVTDLTQWSKRIPKTRLVDRDAFLTEQCAGRDVVHLGACDAPFAAAKAKSGELLHQRLRGQCRNLVGVDNDQPSIALLNNDYGIDDIVYRDLSAADRSIEPLGDLVLCGDVIEHVNNVGDLLFNCNRLCRPGGRLIVSTINATALRVAGRAVVGREAVHPDHVAYYSMATLGVMVSRMGWEMSAVRFFAYGSKFLATRWFFGMLYAMAPQSADGVIVVAEKVREL